jgi:hypothetical protein
VTLMSASVLMTTAVTVIAQRPSEAIVRGTLVSPAPPWMALVLRNIGPFEYFSCSGSIVAPNVVLTAAHCVTDPIYSPGDVYKDRSDPDASSAVVETNTFAAAAMRVAVGATDAQNAPEQYGLTTVHVHPQFKHSVDFVMDKDGTPKWVRCDKLSIRKRCRVVKEVKLESDVALVELDTELRPAFQPIALARAVDGNAVAYGYGQTDHHKDGRLRRTALDAYTLETDCKEGDGLCATTTTSYTDEGDSGGPWLQRRNGVDVQVGITSLGNNRTHYPADVGKALSWIRSLLPVFGESGRAVLIAGTGDYGSAEGKQRLVQLLADAGYAVTDSEQIPADLSPFDSVWWIDTAPVPPDAADRLVAFVKSGRGLYLTGERPCCEALNATDESIVNRLVVNVGGVGVGGLRDICYCNSPQPINSGVVRNLASRPFALNSWQPDAPGGLSNVPPDFVLAYHGLDPVSGTPIAAAWDSSVVLGQGRLVVLMDINWIAPASSGDNWAEVAQNLALFLSNLTVPPANPVAAPAEATIISAQETIIRAPSQAHGRRSP